MRLFFFLETEFEAFYYEYSLSTTMWSFFCFANNASHDKYETKPETTRNVLHVRESKCAKKKRQIGEFWDLALFLSDEQKYNEVLVLFHVESMNCVLLVPPTTSK